jgi:hypothetical protein
MHDHETPPNPEMTGSKPQTGTEKSSLFYTLNRILAIAGILSIVAGIVFLYVVLAKPATALPTALSDGLFNLSMGVLFVVSSVLLSKSKVLVIWLFGAILLMSLSYSYLMGRGINYIMVVAGAFVIWQMFKLKKNKEIS